MTGLGERVHVLELSLPQSHLQLVNTTGLRSTPTGDMTDGCCRATL